VIEIYAVSSRVRQDTFIIYEPLLLLAVIYMVIAGLLALGFKLFEQRFNRGMLG
jgi:polar amino acid transport system permease protein